MCVMFVIKSKFWFSRCLLLYHDTVFLVSLQFDELSLASNPESPQPLELEPVRQRRTRIPDKPNYYLNLWSIMKNCIGKELSKIPMPVRNLYTYWIEYTCNRMYLQNFSSSLSSRWTSVSPFRCCNVSLKTWSTLSCWIRLLNVRAL